MKEITWLQKMNTIIWNRINLHLYNSKYSYLAEKASVI